MTATDDVRAEREGLCDWPDCGCEGDEVCRLAQHVLLEEKRADRATARAERAEAEVARLRDALERSASLFAAFVRGVACRDVHDRRMTKEAATAWGDHAIAAFRRDIALQPRSPSHG